MSSHHRQEGNHEYIVAEPPRSEQESSFVGGEQSPLVSFVIPAYNDEKKLTRCLNSIRAQDYPKIEIIVADNGSTDRSVRIAEQVADQVLHVDGKLGKVRQMGFEAANGQVLGTFDSDIVFPHQHWLSNALTYFNYDENVANVWPKNTAPPWAGPLANAYFNHWEVIMEDRIANERGILGGGVSLLRASAVEEVGGIDHDVHSGEDFNLGAKLKEAGYTIVYIRDPVYHDTDMGSVFQFTRKQIARADRFAGSEFSIMGLSLRDVLYEQVVLGLSGMKTGLIRDRDASWLWFPLLLLVRCIAYGPVYLRARLNR